MSDIQIPDELKRAPVHILRGFPGWFQATANTLTPYVDEFPGLEDVLQTLREAGNTPDFNVEVHLIQAEAAVLYWAIERHNGNENATSEA